jgi:hypothetical protein
MMQPNILGMHYMQLYAARLERLLPSMVKKIAHQVENNPPDLVF